MKRQVTPHNSSRQQGLVMIAMLLLVFMAGTSMYFVSMSDRHGDIKNIVDYNNEMVSAKEALIAYAANYADILPAYATDNLGPGRLPCPDIDRDGAPETSCDGGDQLIFRLPISVQKSTGDQFYFSRAYTEGPVGASFSQLWYAVSPDYAASNSPVYPLNSSTDGLLSVDSVNDYVAVIIAPGEPHNGQNRTTSENKNNRNNYLEAPNNSTVTGVFSNYADEDTDDFNDRLIGITRAEVMTAVTMKVVEEIKRVLDDHYVEYEGHPLTAYFDYECLNSTHCYPRDDIPPATNCGFLCFIFGLPPLPSTGNVPRYETVMEDGVDDGKIATWYEDDDWEDVITYDKISDNEATLVFAECAITYTLRYNTEPEIERSAHSC